MRHLASFIVLLLLPGTLLAEPAANIALLRHNPATPSGAAEVLLAAKRRDNVRILSLQGEPLEKTKGLDMEFSAVCQPGDENGLYLWDQQQQRLRFLLGGLHLCQQNLPEIIPQRQDGSLDYLRLLITEPNGSVTISADGKWIAVAGLSIAEDAKSAERRPRLQPQHRRILLVDVEALADPEKKQSAVSTLFDTYVYTTSEYGDSVESKLPLRDYFDSLEGLGLAQESAVGVWQSGSLKNMQSGWWLPERWGASPLTLQFSADSKQLYFRVMPLASNQDKAFVSEDLYLKPTPRHERLDLGAHLSFAFNLSLFQAFYSNKESVQQAAQQYRAFGKMLLPKLKVIPNQPYVAQSTLLHTGIDKRAFSISEATPQHAELLATMHLHWLGNNANGDNRGYSSILELTQHCLPNEAELCREEPIILNSDWLDEKLGVPFVPYIQWLGDSLLFRPRPGELRVIKRAAIEKALREVDIAADVPTLKLEGTFSNWDNRLRFHGKTILATEADRLATRVLFLGNEYLPAGELGDEMAVAGDYLVTTQPVGPNLPGTFAVCKELRPLFTPPAASWDSYNGMPLLYNMRDKSVGYALYPGDPSALFNDYNDGIWANTIGAPPRELFERNVTALAGNFRYPTLDLTGRFGAAESMLFLEARDQRDKTWPTLSRIPLKSRNQANIERLTPHGWQRGDSAPLTGIVSYATTP